MEHHYSLLLQKYTNFILAFILLLLSFFAYSSMEFELDASSDTLILEQDENTTEELNDDINDDIYINSIFDFFSNEDDNIENIENEDTK